MLKLILADNQAIFRAGIAKVLAVEDEMRIVAQAQTPEQMFMALDKFRAAVLVVAAGFHNDFAAIVQGANKAKTRVIVLADTGESAQKHMSNGAHGVVYRNVTSAALVDCVRKVARGETWVQDVAVPSELTENDMVGLRVRDRQYRRHHDRSHAADERPRHRLQYRQEWDFRTEHRRGDWPMFPMKKPIRLLAMVFQIDQWCP